jgi:AAA domain-containing protein
MARLTKSEIERQLLAGAQLTWVDPNKKGAQAQLTDAKQRRLFAFLLTTRVRQPTGLPTDFIDGLAAAFRATDDPASITTAAAAGPTTSGPWRLQSIETENFGGLNTWNGGAFQFNFDQKSMLLEGPNGSGKSSLIGAILWALTGERPRDQTDAGAHEPKPVFSKGDKPAGNWPPIACYPNTVSELKLLPSVRVKLQFADATGAIANVERTLANGGVTANFDSAFSIPSIILETGLLMPARLSQLRLDEGEGRLTDAVQTLTGLDDLIAMGTLVDGLCHKTREYRSYRAKEFVAKKTEFDQAIKEARDALAPVKVDVPSFVPADTDNDQGAMVAFGKLLKDRAAELAQVVSGDLASELQLSSAQTQNQVIVALSAAEADLKAGIEGLEIWKQLGSISASVDNAACHSVTAAISLANKEAEEAVQLLNKSADDSKFQLKAVAARWHADHSSGAIDSCPLCEHDLKSKPSLIEQLEALRSAGDAAARTFDDNIRAILDRLNSALPLGVNKIGPEILALEPRTKLIDDLRAQFVVGDRYSKCLVRVASIVEEALANAPSNTSSLAVVPTEDGSADLLRIVNLRIRVIERLVALAKWFRENSGVWSDWWQLLAEPGVPKEPDPSKSDAVEPRTERLMEHLSRLSEALSKAEPYRKAALAMGSAWKAGVIASTLGKEIAERDEIADSLAPLKSLNGLCEAVARDAINGLSSRISKLLEKILLSERLQFHNTQLDRKEGLVVRGGFAPELHIDATLVANTSWLRAVLWCFLFALREEAVEQLGADPFPVLALDDPQSTFDAFHRARWAQYVADLQNGPSKLQVILTTYDESFLDLIKTDGITGRQGLIAAPGASCDHVTILEGAALDREWATAQSVKTPRAGVDYLIHVRIYIEGLLKLMLRGEDAAIPGHVLGKLRELLTQMNAAKKTPWDRPVFDTLIGLLAKTRSEIRYIEGAHHSTGCSFGMGEAATVETFWRKHLGPVLERAFKTTREHRLLHGGMKALYAVPSTAILPEGYRTKVGAIPLTVLGRAAALTDGRIADGKVEMDEFTTGAHVAVALGRHFAYRLTARTLEPVARPGDILLVREVGEPTPKSLVVALSEERILARRLEIAENHTDVAVLTAQSINPREIAPPVIAHKSTFSLFKIIGILYGEAAWSPPTATSADEVCDCGGEAVLTHLTSDALGLVEVVGQSAEPHALNGQFLIVKSPIAPDAAFKTLEGKPVIAADNDDNCYFKRLRIPTSNQIVLESLDTGGDYPPVVLLPPGTATNSIKSVWPVAGILFERPN